LLTLGIDTSNYTTSAAFCDGGRVLHERRPLPVKPGTLGLRQGDALFHHTLQLPDLLEALFSRAAGETLSAVGVSDKPRGAENSYMPCFLPGVAAARNIAAVLGVPLFRFSHQQGHLAAALFSNRRADLLKAGFIAFHVSGGTTECLHVKPGLEAEILGGSGDLKAGQLVDRIGVLLGYPFPAGPSVDALAAQGNLIRGIRPSVEGMQCSFSGVETKLRQMVARGVSKEDVSLYCLISVAVNLEVLAQGALLRCGPLPMLFTGGVCCSNVIRSLLGERFPEAMFADPEFSGDNAAGIAMLAGVGMGMEVS
jgi:N6-L-threonylcarbamoyladenine synthase